MVDRPPPALYFANVNYHCNERCIFCAAGLAGGPRRLTARPRGLTLADVDAWLGASPPRPGDVVSLAGGEPTLHPHLPEIVRRFAACGAEVSLFTNGLRLRESSYAERLLDAGVTHFQISLFGARDDPHDAITRRPGSFARTMQGLAVLSELRRERDFLLEIRLLVADQCIDENPATVDLLVASGLRVDKISLNRLILSRDADVARSSVSWARARRSVNDTLRRIRGAGIAAGFESVPLCVYDEENRDHLEGLRASSTPHRSRRQLHYLDPFVAVGQRVEDAPPVLRADAGPCTHCAAADRCGGVEEWYVERHGTAGLQALGEVVARAGH